MDEKIIGLDKNKDIDRRLEETTKELQRERGKTDGCDPDVRRSDL